MPGETSFVNRFGGFAPLPTRGMICISFPSDTLVDLSGGALAKTEVTSLADTTGTPILPEPPEYMAFLVETPEGCYWIICLNDPVNHVDPLGLDAEIGYRRLGIVGLSLLYPVAGHSFLIFNNKNTGEAWKSTLLRWGMNPASEDVTMSFHPDAVGSDDTSLNRVWTLVTDSSAVLLNRPEDLVVAEGRSGMQFRITSDEAEQIRLFELAMRSAQINNRSPVSHDQAGPYSFPYKNCSSWAKDLIDQAQIQDKPEAAFWFMNFGVGQERLLDLTLVPQASYLVLRGGVTVYDAGRAAALAGAEATLTGARRSYGAGRKVVAGTVDVLQKGKPYYYVDPEGGQGYIGFSWSL